MVTDKDPWACISSGVRELVRWMNKMGFKTTDSGDGSNDKHGMGCAVPYPMVAVLSDSYYFFATADRLHRRLKERGVVFGNGKDNPRIEASYNPHDGVAVVVLVNVTDEIAGLWQQTTEEKPSC